MHYLPSNLFDTLYFFISQEGQYTPNNKLTYSTYKGIIYTLMAMYKFGIQLWQGVYHIPKLNELKRPGNITKDNWNLFLDS